jgi:hypothetical protein
MLWACVDRNLNKFLGLNNFLVGMIQGYCFVFIDDF